MNVFLLEQSLFYSDRFRVGTKTTVCKAVVKPIPTRVPTLECANRVYTMIVNGKISTDNIMDNRANESESYRTGKERFGANAREYAGHPFRSIAVKISS